MVKIAKKKVLQMFFNLPKFLGKMLNFSGLKCILYQPKQLLPLIPSPMLDFPTCLCFPLCFDAYSPYPILNHEDEILLRVYSLIVRSLPHSLPASLPVSLSLSPYLPVPTSPSLPPPPSFPPLSLSHARTCNEVSLD